MSDSDDKRPDGEGSQAEVLYQVVARLTEIQEKDTEVKHQELSIRAKEIESNERIALRSIEAQERTQVDHRDKFNKHLVHRYYYIIAILVVTFIFAGYVFSNGGKDLIIEIIKLVLAFGSGIFGGFQYGKNKKKTNE